MQLIRRLKQLSLITGDFLLYIISLFFAVSIRQQQWAPSSYFQTNWKFFIPVFFVWIIINYINGLYDLDDSLKGKKLIRRSFETGFISLIVGMLFFYLMPKTNFAPKTILLLTIIIGYNAITFWRIFFNTFAKLEKLQTNVLYVGYCDEIKEIIELTEKNPAKGYKTAAIIDLDKKLKTKNLGIDIYTELNKIRPVVSTKKINLVVIAPQLHNQQEAIKELYELLFWKTKITDLSSFYETLTGRVPPMIFSESWFLQHLGHADKPIYSKFKNALDFFLAIILTTVFLFLTPFIAIAIKLDSSGPVFFKQKRIGKYGEIFYLYKFRSMEALAPDGSAETKGAQFATKNDTRITKVGNFLRKVRLDEIPQCINLLKRDITFIGPRPERPEIVKNLEKKMPYYSLRHIVKPGITGWAAIHQNYTATLEASLEKLQYDLFYIKNRSFLLDLSIILRTVNVVLRLRGQ
jgi:exopolysaccharide biosynthesis polyprenyl glycosylphosphotransferase